MRLAIIGSTSGSALSQCRSAFEPHRPEVHDLPSIHPDFNSAEPKQAFSCRDSGRRVWTDRG
jgi:hypothetical protein